MFRSRLEERVSDLLCNLGVKYEYEDHRIPYQIQHFYLPDFHLANGIFLETKGYWSAADRRKTKNIIEQNPQVDIRMVFQNENNRISKKSKTTYAMWCDKHNIKHCQFTDIPISWLT
tara:strand:- start:1241 stop:1591 length:351 start_codon:yes stop_codon:yes gene_type:complete